MSNEHVHPVFQELLKPFAPAPQGCEPSDVKRLVREVAAINCDQDVSNCIDEARRIVTGYECPFCEKTLPNERSACCGEVGHARPVKQLRGLQVLTQIARGARSNDLLPEEAEALLDERAALLKACKQAISALKGREHDGFLRDAIAKAEGHSDGN